MQNMATMQTFEHGVCQGFARSQEYLLRNGVSEQHVMDEYKELEASVKQIVRSAYMTGTSDGLQLAIQTATEGRSYGGRK